MSNIVNRKVHPPKFKVNVVPEMLKEQQAVSQICSRFEIHPSQAHAWKRIVLEGMPALFNINNRKDRKVSEQSELIDELYQRIGEQQVALDWLKKSWVIDT